MNAPQSHAVRQPLLLTGPMRISSTANQTLGWKLWDLNSAKSANTLLLSSPITHLLRLKTKGVKAIFSLVSLLAELVSSQILRPSQSHPQGTLTYTPPLILKFVFKVHSTWESLYSKDSSQFTLSGEEPPRKHAYQGSQRVILQRIY